MSDLQKYFGKRLRAERISRGMTQQTLADQLGLSKEMIGGIERGSSAPSFQTIGKITSLLNVPPSSFFPLLDDVVEKSPQIILLGKVAEMDDVSAAWVLDLLKLMENKPSGA